MDFFTGLMVYFVVWWTVIFCVLPWGVKRDEAGGTGAPIHPQIRKKFLITTGVSFLVWGAIYVLIEANIIDFRGISMGMIAEDFKTVDTRAPMP
ncbi:MAG: DUF1467 family protein [Alphaproteobacteria bacterium]